MKNTITTQTTLTDPILYARDLKSTEKILYTIISKEAKDKGYFSTTNAQLAKILDMTVVSVVRLVYRLTERGYIKWEYEYFPDSKKIKGRKIYTTI